MVLKGKAHVVGDDINTDYIISGKYKFKTLDMKELSSHLLEDIDPDFSKKVAPGDILVGGLNFGCGSSREQAPLVIGHAGIPVVIAKSFARIFYRNGINVGLVLLEADTSGIGNGDDLEVDLGAGVIRNLTAKTSVRSLPLPEFLLKIVREGGVVNYIKKHGSFSVNAGEAS